MAIEKTKQKLRAKLVGNSCVLTSKEAAFISRMSTEIIVTLSSVAA